MENDRVRNVLDNKLSLLVWFNGAGQSLDDIYLNE